MSVRRFKQTQSTNWVFTLNNYNEEELFALGVVCDLPRPFKKSDSVVSGLACSQEVGKKGTPHLQGYLQLTKKGMQGLDSILGSAPDECSKVRRS